MSLGGATLNRIATWLDGVGSALQLLGEALLWVPRASWRMRREIGRQFYTSGIGGIPVVLIVAFFSGAVLALQFGRAISEYGQEDLVGRVVAISMCREMGPVMTGIILAGLLGSKIASELGTMAVSEEVDALHVMSISPIKFLVMPRVLTLLLIVPLLTVYADVVGIIGGGLVSQGVLNVDLATYMQDTKRFLKMRDIYVGLFKSLIYGATIGTVACYQGLHARHGARGVGENTMRTVVISMLYIIVFNYIIGWLFFTA